jgi:hypothetical protein
MLRRNGKKPGFRSWLTEPVGIMSWLEELAGELNPNVDTWQPED